MEIFFTYIMANDRHIVLYVGSTGNMKKRGYLHRGRLLKGFTFKYNVTILVYFEEFRTEQEAIDRENQIKKMTRKRKEDLIYKTNPSWRDLYLGFKERS